MPLLSADPNNWKLVVNRNYQDVMNTLMSLTTASLVVPFLLIKNFLAVPKDQPLSKNLPCAAYWFWALMFASLVCDAVFFYASAKFVKAVTGGTEHSVFFYAFAKFVKAITGGTEPSYENFVEQMRDTAIWGASVFFAAGLVSFAVLGWKILHRR